MVESQAPIRDSVSNSKEFVTVSDVIEHLGLTAHHWYTVMFTWWVWVFLGWTATLVVYLLDAAGEVGSDWTRITSSDMRLTVEDKSIALLTCGILAAIANPFLGCLSDVCGRIITTEICICAGVVAMVGFIVARTKFILLLFVCLNPFLKDGAGVVTQSLLAEWLPIQWRGVLIVSLHAVWNVGRLAVTFLWAVLPPAENWVAFFAVAIVPPVILVVYVRFRGWRYESPRWFAVTGNMVGCIGALKLAASSSARSEPLPRGWDDAGILQVADDAGRAVQSERRTRWEQLAELLVPDVRWKLSVLGIMFFALFFGSLSFFYWAIEYFKEVGLHAAIVPAMIAAPVGKIVSNLMLIMGGPGRCLIDRCPRIPLMALGFFGFGICVCAMCYFSSVFAITAVVFLSQVFEEIVWSVGSVYMTEAFPTAVRNSAIGVICTGGNIGGILGTSLCGALMEWWVYLPMITIASFLFVGGLSCFLLKDERGCKALSDTTGYDACA